MEAIFLSQPSISFANILRKISERFDSVSIAVAYITDDGLREIEGAIALKNVRIICGIHGCISDLHALNKFSSYHKDRIKGKICINPEVFHPKLYIFYNHNNYDAEMLIGSPNLTKSGLNTNREISIKVRGNKTTHPIIDALNYFDEMWKTCSIPVDKYLQEYPNYRSQGNKNERISVEQKNVLA